MDPTALYEGTGAVVSFVHKIVSGIYLSPLGHKNTGGRVEIAPRTHQ